MTLQVCHLSCLRGQPVGGYYRSLASSFSPSPTTNTRAKLCNPQFLSDGDFSRNLSKKVNSRACVLKCSSSSSHSSQANLSDSKQLVELPLFPLPLVLFPGSTLPLQIFEFRYRIMMHTLLHGNQRFGIIYSDSSNGGPVDVGCVGEVVKHERLVDDRFFVIVKGQERFRVVNVVRTKPYLVAEVQWLEDRPCISGEQDVESLAFEVETCMKDVIRLSNKINGKLEDEARDLRRDLFPTPFSFFVGSTFEGAPKEQQALLALEDTSARLRREKKTLRNTLNYLAAASAIKDAFQYSSSNEN